MVRKLTVTQLYGLYDYSLSFDDKCRPICFISGPNGYGKTSLLSLLNAVLVQDVKFLLNPELDFSQLEVELDEISISIDRTKTDRAPIDQDETDYFVELDIEVRNSADGCIKESININTDNAKEGKASFPTNIAMYLRSQSCIYLRDDRLFDGNGSSDENVMDVYQKIYTRMRDFEHDMNYKLDYTRTMYSGNEDKKEPLTVKDSEMEEVRTLLERYHKVGLLKSHNLNHASSTDPRMLAAAASLEEDRFLLQMESFKKWIDESCLSNKKLVIDIEKGALFVMDNDNLLLPMSLSSGEKHLYVQAYQLTVGANEGSVVLIDEPEMSYHPAWLTDYMEHIMFAARSQNLQIILATHSPAIFGYDFDRCIDLYSLSHNDNGNAE